MSDFNVGDRIRHIERNISGTVTKIFPLEKDVMLVLFDTDAMGELPCINDFKYFELLFREPSKAEKQSWQSLWNNN